MIANKYEIGHNRGIAREITETAKSNKVQLKLVGQMNLVVWAKSSVLRFNKAYKILH